jgi:uncharacterized protein
VYNKADTTWKSRPPLMSDDIFETTLGRISSHCRRSGQRGVGIFFHGGEPTLVGAEKFGRWCTRIREMLGGLEAIEIGVQTNGTLLDEEWMQVLRDNNVVVGISVDGPKEIHDIFRIDHSKRGSYEQVKKGLRKLQAASVPHRVLTVIPLGENPLRVHRHIVGLGSKLITYILPDFTHDDIAAIRRRYGATPCADFLIPIFDDWWFHGTMDVTIRDLWNIARIILGGRSEIETYGNLPPSYVFVETDGEIEGLDCLRCCEEGMSRINLNVQHSDFAEILDGPTMHSLAIFEGMPLPSACTGCPEEQTCAGGYLPHRYSSLSGFDNPSVWCADILKLFAHIRRRLEVPPRKTRALRARYAAGAS